MKRTLLLTFLIVMAAAVCSAKTDHLLKFSATEYEFGNITESSPSVVHEYEFVNTASEPVAILSVTTGCGCTRPEYPIKPVAPGEKAVIKVTFVPRGQSGEINKSIQVRYRAAKASSAKRITLRLKGFVSPEKSK